MPDERTDLSETLSRLAVRAAAPEYDPRHAILDVAPELLGVGAIRHGLPPHLVAEMRDLTADVRAVLPPFPSRRNTSPLFDRAGLGRVGYQHAERLVRRLVALAKAVRKAGVKPSVTEP